MTDPTNSDQSKILDPDLARAAREGDEGPTVVLVEIAAPHVDVTMRRADRGGPPRFTPAAAPPPSEDQVRQTEESRLRVEALLTEVSSEPPRWIAAARAFAASVAPAQLGRIAASDDVRSIAPSVRRRGV